ncbi:hypothetical protein FACS1894211_04100 [Clostridia bacterium]|nr:hypothetical protein FACS1894211_04100 [Clostridia bacterium]
MLTVITATTPPCTARRSTRGSPRTTARLATIQASKRRNSCSNATARNNGYKVYDIYKDDGYTGLNFNRPDFQRLLKDVEDGKVNLVITKDLSRLGRDYIQTGYYTEIYFASKNVRYIAVNDNTDTLRGDNDMMPFQNIMNDRYSKDISDIVVCVTVPSGILLRRCSTRVSICAENIAKQRITARHC